MLVLDEAHRRVGFRTIEWDSTPDAAGTPVHPEGQRHAGLREGRELDSG